MSINYLDWIFLNFFLLRPIFSRFPNQTFRTSLKSFKRIVPLSSTFTYHHRFMENVSRKSAITIKLSQPWPQMQTTNAPPPPTEWRDYFPVKTVSDNNSVDVYANIILPLFWTGRRNRIQQGVGAHWSRARVVISKGFCDLVKNYSFCWILFYVSKIVYTLLFLFTILYSISYTASLVILERYE